MTDRYRNWLLSGGIGSGKSLVRGMFEDHGLATIDADSVGHEVLASDQVALDAVAARWPSVERAGAIDRKALAEIVFADRNELRALEAITHPRIFDLIGKTVGDQNGPVIVEIPVLGQPFPGLWRRMVVDASDETRIARAMERGGTREDVERRMAMQPNRAEWLASADVVIPNASDFDALRLGVAAVVAELFEPSQPRPPAG